MAIMHLRHRYLILHYIYPALCLLLIFLLIHWNMQPKVQIIGRQGHEWESDRPIRNELNRMPAAPMKQIPEDDALAKNKVDDGRKLLVNGPEVQPLPNPTKSAGNIVSLIVYMEAQCPDTSSFVRRHLLPTWKKLGYLNRLNVTLVPFGKAKCVQMHDLEDFNCECQHGPAECDLNALMNCVIENKVHARNYIPLIGCIQGQNSLNSATLQCLNEDVNKDWLVECATSSRGRYLMAIAGQRTEALGSQFDFVPWIVLDNERDIDSFYALEENVCKKLHPTPAECQSNKNLMQNVF